jgi:hypothetical protein
VPIKLCHSTDAAHLHRCHQDELDRQVRDVRAQLDKELVILPKAPLKSLSAPTSAATSGAAPSQPSAATSSSRPDTTKAGSLATDTADSPEPLPPLSVATVSEPLPESSQPPPQPPADPPLSVGLREALQASQNALPSLELAHERALEALIRHQRASAKAESKCVLCVCVNFLAPLQWNCEGHGVQG